MPPSLSCLIIAKDEECDLPGCLESVRGLAREIVVLVDAASSDGTERLAREAGCRVERRPFDDYARQRQAALELCREDWVLWIDADERVSPGLRERLPELLELRRGASGWTLRFQVRFLGRELRWGGLGGERHLRLFRREGARFVGGLLHEGVELPGPIGEYAGPGLLHEPYRDLSDYLSKLDRYTDLAARQRFASGRRFRVWDHLRLPGEFLWRAVFRGGVLDGFPGVVWAGLAAFHSWLKYVKLKSLHDR